MEKYTVLLVDDEEEVSQIIRKKINWEELGFSVIGYADNGIKALEMVEELQPNIVMTDIKMPYMDGMELANRIKTDYPATKILIFTGFDEFEYAKEAVHLEVEEYILKPASRMELTRVFTRLKEKLDQEIHERKNVEILQKYYLDSLPLLQANFYTTLVEGKIREEEIPKFLSDYQISFSGPFFCCAVIHTSSSQAPEDVNPLLLATSVQKQAEERLGKPWRAKCFSYLGNTVLIAQLKEEREVSELTDACDRFCKYMHCIIGAVVTIGVGQVCKGIMEVAGSYSGAREAVSCRVIYGSMRAINIKEIIPQEKNMTASSNDTELSNLFKMIRLGTEEDIREAVEQYLEKTFSPEKSLQQHDIDVMELVSALCRFSVNNNMILEEFWGDMRNLYAHLLDLEPDILRIWLTKISLSFREKLINARSQSTQSFVTRAKEYVRNHYGDAELSLDHLCKELCVSNSYFSTVFKKETGTSFIGYLTDYRMDQAERQLIETNEKSYIIARNVGYTDPNYFSYVFKRKFGLSPSKYRTEHAESEK